MATLNPIERAVRRGQWKKARLLIRNALRKRPDDHWLLTRLSLTYYEEFDYKRSLRYSERALALAPRCPLVLWDYAGTLEMLGQFKKAAIYYRRLVRRGLHSIANDDCSEGMVRARGLLADCWYRLGNCEREMGRRSRAVQHFKRHLSMRGPSCGSIYAVRTVKRELHELCA